MPAIILEPVVLREVIRIKILPPMFIQKAAAAYP
jgi:hypothetical protein